MADKFGVAMPFAVSGHGAGDDRPIPSVVHFNILLSKFLDSIFLRETNAAVLQRSEDGRRDHVVVVDGLRPGKQTPGQLIPYEKSNYFSCNFPLWFELKIILSIPSAFFKINFNNLI